MKLTRRELLTGVGTAVAVGASGARLAVGVAVRLAQGAAVAGYGVALLSTALPAAAAAARAARGEEP
jgi:hypothetical protein